MVAWEYKIVGPFLLAGVLLYFVQHQYPAIPQWVYSAILLLLVLALATFVERDETRET
jgi:hypothetical protein